MRSMPRPQLSSCSDGKNLDPIRTTDACRPWASTMIINVAAEAAGTTPNNAITLREPDDLKALGVDAVASSPSSLVEALEQAGACRSDDGYVWIDPDFVRQAALPS